MKASMEVIHISIITPACSIDFNHQLDCLWMSFPAPQRSHYMCRATATVPGLCPKCALNCLQLRSLLLTLLAVLSASGSAHGKVIHPRAKPESLFKQAYAGCLSQKHSKFPQTMRVNISISTVNQDTKMTPNVNSRSLAPWDYRYGLCP